MSGYQSASIKYDFTFDELVERYRNLETYSMENILSFYRNSKDGYTAIPYKHYNYRLPINGIQWSFDEKISFEQEREVIEFVLFERQVLGVEK